MGLLKNWVAHEMVKRLDRVLNRKIAWETLDYEFFKKENDRHFFFESEKKRKDWWGIFCIEYIDYLAQRLEAVNGISREELDEMEVGELDLLVINNMAEEILEDMPKNVEWETPIVWTKDLLKHSSLGKYMEE